MQRLVGRIGDEFRRRQVAFANGQHDQPRLAQAPVPDVDDLRILELEDVLADGQGHAGRDSFTGGRRRISTRTLPSNTRATPAAASGVQTIALEPGGDAERHDGEEHGRIGRPIGADSLDQGEEGAEADDRGEERKEDEGKAELGPEVIDERPAQHRGDSRASRARHRPCRWRCSRSPGSRAACGGR